jgi:hypothetical protein
MYFFVANLPVEVSEAPPPADIGLLGITSKIETPSDENFSISEFFPTTAKKVALSSLEAIYFSPKVYTHFVA